MPSNAPAPQAASRPSFRGTLQQGDLVALTDIRNDILVDVVRVTRIDDERGRIAVERYTHDFDLHGCGVALHETRTEELGWVISMLGTVLSPPTGTREVTLRYDPPRLNLRPANDEDRAWLAAFDELALDLEEMRLV